MSAIGATVSIVVENRITGELYGALMRLGRPVEPSACRWCGIPKRDHAQQWVNGVGWHCHADPTDRQIKARMIARREARKGQQ